MKKAYDSMEAYKVCFNANEQVAAACQVSDIGSKYDMSNGSGAVVACNTAPGKYSSGDQSCFADDSMISANLKYAS